MIDSRAVIDPSAKIATDVEIGPYSIIGPGVEIDTGTWIGSNAVVFKNTQLGKNNKIYQFASVGTDPQDLTCQGEHSRLVVGDGNTFHPGVTINRGTTKQDSETRIGNHNLFMTGAHVAHDCLVGDHTVFVNNAALGGHVTVDDYAMIGAFCTIHQFCHVGRYAYITRSANIIKDVLPFLLVSGSEPKIYGINVIGLERKGFSAELIQQLKRAYKIIFRKKLTLNEAKKELRLLIADCAAVDCFIDGIERAARGITR